MTKRISAPKLKLTDAQRRMYAAEKETNFRILARLFATPSSHILTRAERIPDTLRILLSDIGRYAEVAFGKLDPEFMWRNMDDLMQPGYPLAGCDALRGSALVGAFRGKVASLQGYVAYRPAQKQAVITFSGTSCATQAILDVDARRSMYPSNGANTSTKAQDKKSKKAKVHAGFWRMYQGVHTVAFDTLRTCLKTKDVQEIVITGHSLGAAHAYLFALELLQIILGFIPDVYNLRVPLGIALKILGFGSPRVGNKPLTRLFRDLVISYREKYGKEALCEYCVRNHVDGVNDLPPHKFGYKHFSLAPLYGYNGYQYYIPESEKECTEFQVEPCADNLPPDFPKGGHNYYNNRDMAQIVRLFGALELDKKGPEGWQERYMRYLGATKNSTVEIKDPVSSAKAS